MNIKSKVGRRFSDEEIIRFINQVTASNEAGSQSILDKLCHEQGFSRDEFEKWRKQYGNKFSVDTHPRRFNLTEPYLSIAQLANEQHLYLESVLHFASQGLIPIFTFLRQPDATFLYVHRDFVAPHGLTLPESVLSLSNISSIGISRSCCQDISGVFLNAQDCSELLKEGRVSQGLFPAALRRRFNRYSVEPAIPGYLPHDRYPDIDPKGWRVACYPNGTALVFDREIGFPVPTILKISLSAVYVLREDIESFFSIIDNETFLSDLLVTPIEDPLNNDWKTLHVVVDKPPYISAKLTHLIETSERFWRRNRSNDVGDYSEQRAKVCHALKDGDFLSNFKMAKDKVSKDLREAAARFIEPLYARNISNEGKLSGHAYLSPELLIFLATAKLFWSPSCVDYDDPATHPRNEQIKAYLRFRGIPGNDADYAATLIRPEQAKYGGRKSSMRQLDRHNPLLWEPPFPPTRNGS